MIKTVTLSAAAFIMMLEPAYAQVSRVDNRVTIQAGSCSGCDLSGKDMHGLRLKDANFAGSLFNRSNLSGGEFYGADLQGAHFKKAFLARVKGKGVNLTGANLSDATLTEMALSHSKLTGANVRGADLARASFHASDFNEAALNNVKALGADFKGSHFVNARLNGANLTGANFNETVCHDAKFGDANVEGATFEGANLSGAKMGNVIGLQQAQLDLACGNARTDLPIGLSVPYCVETEMAEGVPHPPEHPKLKQKEKYIAARVDRAIGNVESLMHGADTSTKRQLERVHADLMAVRRTVEE